jgi:uncharacterized membrane protein
MILRRRHIAKALTWRLVASTSTFLISWFITNEIKTGLYIGGSAALIKVVLYYLHERLWYKTKYGVID